VHLLQGLGKADKPDEVIRAATALPVASERLVQTERSVARLSPERGSGRLDRWRRIAVEAARQSGRGDIPALEGPSPLGEALAAVDAPLRVTLAASAEPLFSRLGRWRGSDPLALLVGPEGGLDAAERQLAASAGFLPASLGSTTLRTELAGVAALGALVALAAAPIDA
jgi:16S rRNA (uracil1498-N3)-methyltransferase